MQEISLPRAPCRQRPCSSIQHEVHMHRSARKLDSTLLIFAQNTGLQQRVHIRMHSPHVAANTLRRLEQGDGPGAGQRLHERHAVGREHLSKQVERLERGTFLLPLARKGFPQPLPEGFGRINALI